MKKKTTVLWKLLIIEAAVRGSMETAGHRLEFYNWHMAQQHGKKTDLGAPSCQNCLLWFFLRGRKVRDFGHRHTRFLSPTQLVVSHTNLKQCTSSLIPNFFFLENNAISHGIARRTWKWYFIPSSLSLPPLFLTPRNLVWRCQMWVSQIGDWQWMDCEKESHVQHSGTVIGLQY